MNRRYLGLFFGFLAVAVLAGCGGGGGDSSGDPPQVATKLLAIGPLSSDNAVVVDGVRYDAGRASIKINGQPGTLADLKNGYVVRVNGQRNGNGSFVATKIDFNANVIGPIEEIDWSNGLFTVMGQTVLFDADTIMDANIGTHGLGTIAQVTGFIDHFGRILASRIDLVPDTGEYRLIGRVFGLDHDAFSFHIHGLKIDYGVAVLFDFLAGLFEGLEVIITGSYGLGGIFVSNQINWINYDLSGHFGSDIALCGHITRFASATDFDVAGFRITTNGETRYVGGRRNDLHEGVRVWIDGHLNRSGTVVAERIRFVGDTETETLQFDFAEFSAIEVAGPFNARLEQGSTYDVELTVNSHIVDLLDIHQSGDVLHIGFLPHNNIQAGTLEARITLPLLKRVDLAAATRGFMTGFGGSSLEVNLVGAANLEGVNLSYDSVTLDALAASHLVMVDVAPLGSVHAELSAASTATVNLADSATVTGILSAASTLFYYGSPVDIDVDVQFASSIVRLGDTQN